MEEPKISVLMGVYYRSANLKLLERSVASILEQDESSLELLLCDDGSIPAAQRLLEGLAAGDGRLHLLREGSLFSLPEKLNACLAQARAPFLARMDDDDYSRPDRFSRQLAFLQEHPSAAFVGSGASLRRGGVPVGVRSFPSYPTVRDFLFVQPFLHPTLLFRREALLAVGGYSLDRRCLLCEDYDLLLRLYEAGFAGANLPEPLVDYTVPETARGHRTMGHRWNETVTRYRRFRALGLLPGAWPYVVKPLAVGLVPEVLLGKLKEHTYGKDGA